MTHFATADGDRGVRRGAARARSPRSWRQMRAPGPGIVVHAANSAATLREPASHFDMVRCGIAIYGCDPMNEDPGRARARAGARAELVRRGREARPRGRQRRLRAALHRATARPGSRRCRSATETGSDAALTNNCDVLIGGRRYPLVGTVSMDNITVDVGASPAAAWLRCAGDPDRRRRDAAPDASRTCRSRLGTIAATSSCAGSRARVPRVTTATGAADRELSRSTRCWRTSTERMARGWRRARPAAGEADRATTTSWSSRRRGGSGRRTRRCARRGRRTRSRCRTSSAPGAWSRTTAAGRSI